MKNRDGCSVVSSHDLVEAADPEQGFALAAGVAQPLIEGRGTLEQGQLIRIGHTVAGLEKPGVEKPTPGQRHVGINCVQAEDGVIHPPPVAREHSSFVDTSGLLDAFVHPSLPRG